MKKIKQISICLLLLASISSIGQTMSSGVVKYKMTSDNEQMAMMGDIIMTNYFDKDNVAVEVDMMGGMILTKVYKKINEPNSTKMTMDAMGNKYEIIELDDNAAKGVDMADLDNIATVTLDKATTKEIAGYKCYKATVTYQDDKTGEFYVTDDIKMTSSTKESKLKGFPLEMTIVTPESTLNLKATEVSKDLPKEAFMVPEGFEKVTMEEFQEKMGG
ncbi:DUF4412 domain-containing protein [uncultured Flavobacterium sp.]|uniref:DUF4412 domain-containing protein n=1 Tax=uncultured Flavobacterium sp. TaxID=165435 RepID=UPI0030C7F10F